MKLASGFCIPEPLPVHTGIKGRQVQEVATFLPPSANSLTLVPTGTIEYIAAGDSQAAVPFPTEIGRDFDLQ